MNEDTDLHQLESKLATLDTERAKLILEITNLRNSSGSNQKLKKLPPLLGVPALNEPPISPAEKINFS